MTDPSKFCKQCLEIFSQPHLLDPLGVNREHYTQPIHHTKESLKAAAINGCPLCFMFFEKVNGLANPKWQIIEPDEPLRIRADAESLAPYVGAPRQKGVATQMMGRNGETLEGVINQLHIFGFIAEYIVTLHIVAHPENPAAEYVNRRFNTQDLRSDKIYENARELLSECHEHHGSCGDQKLSVLPTRVLDLASSSGVEVRLHEPIPGELGEYVALSYCWGEAQPAQTTKQTFNNKLREIGKSTLPQSIQDAIFVAQKLGYRFLWVDSLCIIQDSNEDKVLELTKMADIYNKASLTIAASIASKASEGFLHPRKTIPERREISWPDTDGSPGEIELFPDIVKLPFPCPDGRLGEVHLLLPQKSHYDNLEPLNLRGWTMQERLLSRRLLIFGEHEVTWQCQSTLGPKPIIKTLWSYKDTSPRLPLQLYDIDLPPHLRAPPPPNAVIGQGVQWKKIAVEYSRRQLSYIEDKFNAIGGIVQLLQDVWKDEYLAGSWRGNFLYTSLWYRAENSADGKSLDVKSLDGKSLDGMYLAPSWSWLSVNAAVDFWNLESIDAEFVDCHIELQNQDLPFGSIRSGEVIIRGAMWKANEALKNQTFEWKFTMDDGQLSLVEADWASFELNKEMQQMCTFLLIGIVDKSPAGLVLFPVESGKFRRVGCFRIPGCPSWHAKNPFRYTASEDLTNTGKRKWLCQVGRGNVVIV